jgi:hypothetical protein
MYITAGQNKTVSDKERTTWEQSGRSTSSGTSL